jgi:CheY-like chemotaxis protein
MSKILIIDDEEGVVKSLKRLFHSQKVWVTDTIMDASGIDQKLAAFNPDVVIVDVMMPGVDGFEVVRRMRLNPATSHIRIIALSGNYPEDGREMLQSMGVIHCVDKPYNPEDLIKMIKDVIMGYTA